MTKVSDPNVVAQIQIEEPAGPTSRYVAIVKLYRLAPNPRPHWSVTGSLEGSQVDPDGRRRKIEFAPCADHAEILKRFPDLYTFVGLHLSDDRGIPMHAFENGWHWAGGNPGQVGDVQVLSDYLRIGTARAKEIVDAVASGGMTKADFEVYVEDQKPRWAEESEAALATLRGMSEAAASSPAAAGPR